MNEKEKAKSLIKDADAILIGGGAGLSAAAGLDYSEAAFRRDFPEWVEKYGITDLYSSSFYTFPTEEEKWACWSRHIDVIRFRPEGLHLYKALRALVGDRPYFVITTNVDKQFVKSGFDTENIFEVQGDYGLMQCSRGCHAEVYSNEALVKQMVAATENCRIPSNLVPYCPVCGRPMDVHVRKDDYFVETEQWDKDSERYAKFIKSLGKYKKVTLLELGVGFNTPTIIRYPFERMAAEMPNVTLVRVNP